MVLLNNPTVNYEWNSLKLTYRVDTMIQVKVEEPSLWVIFWPTSSEALGEEANLTNEAREMVHMQEKVLKHRIAQRYNSDVIPRKFHEGDLVLWRTNIKPPPPGQGKLAEN